MAVSEMNYLSGGGTIEFSESAIVVWKPDVISVLATELNGSPQVKANLAEASTGSNIQVGISVSPSYSLYAYVLSAGKYYYRLNKSGTITQEIKNVSAGELSTKFLDISIVNSDTVELFIGKIS